MAQRRDGARRYPLEYVADVLVVSADGSIPWTLIGGGSDDESVELHMIVAHPTEPTKLTARVTLTIPIERDGDELIVGRPKVN